MVSFRLVIACVLLLIGGDVYDWIMLHCLYWFVVGICALGSLSALQPVRLFWLSSLKDYRDGIHFSLSHLAQNGQTEVDKVLLGQLSRLSHTGIYTVVWHCIGVVMMPLNALWTVIYPSFFKKQTQDSWSRARLLMPIAAGYGVFASACLWLGAPVLEVLLGSAYQESVQLLRQMAFLPVIIATYTPWALAMAGSGMQGQKMKWQWCLLVLGGCLGAGLIPVLGLSGVVVVSYVCHGIMLVLLLLKSRGLLPMKGSMRQELDNNLASKQTNS